MERFRYIWKEILVVVIIIAAPIALWIYVFKWIVTRPFWTYPFLDWFNTATIGEVVLLFGGVLFAIRFLTTSSVTVKKEE